jgi:hypothetical protein
VPDLALATIAFEIGGNTDASGSFSLVTAGAGKPVSPARWAALKVVAQTTGYARWTVTVNGRPRAFSVGDRCDDVVYVAPGELVDVLITGAVPNALVTGEISGISGDTLTEVAPFVTLVPDVLSQFPGVQQTHLATVSAPGGQVVNSPVFPVGTIQSIGFVVLNGSPFEVFLQGSPTGKSYGDEVNPKAHVGGQSDGPFIMPFDITEDTGFQVVLDNTFGGGNTATVVVIGYSVLFNYRPPGFDPKDLLIPNVSGVISGTLNAGASLTVIAASASKFTRLRNVWFSVAAVAATFGTVEFPAGTSIGQWDGSFSHQVELDGGGLSKFNAALAVKNTSAAVSGALNGGAFANQT